MTITTTIEIEVEVEFTLHKASRGHRDRLGVPEEPDEDAYSEIESVTYNGKKLDLRPDDLDLVQSDVDDYDPEDERIEQAEDDEP